MADLRAASNSVHVMWIAAINAAVPLVMLGEKGMSDRKSAARP